MRYVGGKSGIAGWVADNIVAVKGDATRYVEPFLGSGATFARIAPLFNRSEAGDLHEDLILMWQAVASGWVPPERVTREEYEHYRRAEPSAMRAFVGYGSSFSGKWFGGYVDTAWDSRDQRYTKPYAQAASRSLVKVAPAFANAHLRHCSYADWTAGPGTVIYCDPPYAGTLGYPGSGETFRHDAFWRRADAWVHSGATVVVSEGTAPEHWSILAERERRAMLRVARGGENLTRVERLYIRTVFGGDR